jgi:ankyrin repeat protein
MFYAAREGHTEVIKKLITHFNADTDAVDHNGQTPLYYAARAGKFDAAEFLIKYGGANVNHEDKK